MHGDVIIRDVRGDEVRCSGLEHDQHEEITLFIPPRETVICPRCGQAYRRAAWWNVNSGAIWPRAR